MGKYVIKATLEGETAWLMGMRPTIAGPSDVTWTTHRPYAAEFAVWRAAEETAQAVRIGEIEPA